MDLSVILIFLIQKIYLFNYLCYLNCLLISIFKTYFNDCLSYVIVTLDKMKKVTVKTCACFLDLAIACFKSNLYSPSDYRSKCYSICNKKEIFMLSERTRFEFHVSDGRRITLISTIVSICIKCEKFQINLLSTLCKFNDLTCSFADERFGGRFGDERFGGTLHNNFDDLASEAGSECEDLVIFSENIENINCFTHSKLDYYLHCTNCQEKFREEIEPVRYSFAREKKDEN